MNLKNGLKQQSLAKHQVCALLLGLLMAGVLLAMTVMPSNAREASPPSSWGKTYGGTGNEEAFGVQQTFDGGFIVGGTTSVSGLEVGDLGDFWIVKLDSEGAIEWEKTFGGDGEDFLTAIQQTFDGGYIAGGGTDSFGAGSTDFWVLKLDNDGDTQWEKAYGGSGDDAGAFAIQQTRDGGYIVGGFTRSFGTMGDLLVLKLEPLGNIEWQKTYGGTGIERRVQNIVQTSDEGYILVSSTTSFIPPDVPIDTPPESSVWVLKLDHEGGIQWQKVYGDGDVEDIQPTNDGGYILLVEKMVRPPDPDFWVVKLEDDGDILWERAYGGTELEDAGSIRQTSDGGYIVGGSTRSFAVSGEDSWIIKLDSEGTIQWEKTFGGDGDDEVISVSQTSEGGFIAVGETDSFGVSGRDFLVLRLDSDGDIGCCLGSYLSRTDAIVTSTTVTPYETGVEGVEIEVTTTPTEASISQLSPTVGEQCFFKVIPPGAVAQCLSATMSYTVERPFSLVLIIAAIATAIVFFIAVVSRRRKPKSP